MSLRRSTYSYGPVLAMGLAQGPAEPAQVSAAQAGSTTVDKASAPAAPGTLPRRQDNASAEPMGQAKRAFDYTHGGPEGAELFASIMADGPARQLPDLHPSLIP